MPYHQQISPFSIANDCLDSTKYLALRDAYGAMESSTPQLRQAYTRMAQDHLAMADEWFRLMQTRGWYQVPQARPEIVTRTLSHVQSLTANTLTLQPPGRQQMPYGQGQYQGQYR